MGTSDREFSLYPRTRQNGTTVFYARFRRDDGSWSSGKSTRKATRSAAARWAKHFIEDGGAEIHGSEIPTFATWADGFWSPASRFARSRRARGFSLGNNHLRARASRTVVYLVPAFGHQRLDRITPESIEQLLLDLHEKGRRLEDGSYRRLSDRSVNGVRSCLKSMLGEAMRLGIIDRNPVDPVLRFKEHPKVRGIVTREELGKLFAPDALKDVWSGDQKMFVFCFLGAGTGMRQGEIRGLRPKNVHEDYIAVLESWSDYDGLKPPKWNRSREVPLPRRVSDVLHAWIQDNGIQLEALCFTAWNNPARPVSRNAPSAALARALKASGVLKAERLRRNVTFHSLRHTIVTLARGSNVDAWQLRRAIGHSTERMLDHYSDHATGGNGMGAVAEFQNTLFRGNT